MSTAPASPHRPGDLAARRLAETPIAVVGMGGLFPQAPTARDYWQNIVDGTDCTTEVPADRWRVEDHYDPDPAAPDKSYSRRGGFVPDVAFDPLEFGLPPNQLEVTSALQTLSLGVARDTLADAGAPGSTWYDPSRTGCVLGVTGPVPLMHPLAARLATPVLREVVRSCGLTEDDARRIADTYAQAFAPWVENSFPGLLPNVTAGRVANRLGLGGMNSTVDAACAASLSAIRVAIAELVDGRADMMLTGGADTENSIFIYLCFAKVGALSHTDRIRPFDTSADGTLIGEGIGMLALKRLADARRDGDRIYAVIAGVGSSSDGRHKSIYAPRAEGQRLALERAYDDAQFSPATVGLVEAHATGTSVGDRTELTALGGLLAEHGAQPRSVAIGSVKSQIGHTKGAAGTASLMKTAYALHQRVLPGTINIDEPNDALDEGAALYPNTRTRPWVRDPRRPRRAGVSAMGFGGTNFHVVLEESPVTGPRPVLHRAARATVVHAPDVPALLALLSSDAEVDDSPVPADHVRVGFAAVGEDEAAELRAIAADGLRELPGDTEVWSHPRGIWFRRRPAEDRRVAAVFAGQGSQYVDMGVDAALNNPTVADAFDEAAVAFADADRGLGATVFPPPVFDPVARREQEAALRATEYAQPAIGALSAGQFRSLHERGLAPTAALGHSFGELTALWAAGALSDTDFFTLARARGAAMAPPQDTSGDPGTMAAVSATRERVEELVAAAGLDDVAVCNHNADDQVVVGGGTEQVERFIAVCAEQGVDAKALPVAAAFHTAHVAHAVEPFRRAVSAVEVGEPRVPVLANTAGAAYGADTAANREVLVGQLSAPVEFVAGLEALREHAGIVVEFGPKQVLTGLVRRVLGEDVVAIPTDAGPVGDSDLALEQAAARLAVLGVPLTPPVRPQAPAPPERPAGGMTITVNGAEYVPADRAAAYAEALADDRPLEAVAAARDIPVSTEGPLRSVEPSEVAPRHQAAPAVPDPEEAAVSSHPTQDVLAQHTALHTRYLDGQLDLAQRLVGAWHADAGPDTTERLRAVASHADAMSRAHTRANEVLASLAALEHGAAPVTAPSDGASRSVEPAESAPRQIVASAPVSSEGTSRSVEPAEGAPRPIAADSAPRPATPEADPGPSPAPAGGFDAEALRAVLVEVVADKTGYPPAMVDPGLDLEADLGVDSIKRVQVLGAVQERYPQLPAIGPESLAELRTLDQIVAHLAADAPPATPPVETPTTSPRADTPAATAPTAGVPRRAIELVDLPAREDGALAFAADPVAVLVDRGGPEPDALEAALAASGWTVRRVVLPETVGCDWTPPDGEGLPGLDEALDGRVDACLVVLRDEEDLPSSVCQLADAVLVAGAAREPLARTAAAGTRAAFVTVSRCDGGLGLLGRRIAADAVLAGVGGLVKTLAREAPAIFCRALDLAPVDTPDAAAAVVLDELTDAATDVVEVGVDADGLRRTVRVADTPAPVQGDGTPVRSDDVVVVTGGARGVTAHCVLELARRVAPEIVLLGRTELTEEPAWAAGIPDDELTAAAARALTAAADGVRPGPRDVAAARDRVLAQREVRATLEAARTHGAAVHYAAVDVTDPDQVRAALGDAAHRATVLVHAAGALADAALPDKTRAAVHRVLAPKLAGLHHVTVALRDAPLHTVALFGSVAGVHGNPGQADYALANEALARFGASADRHRSPRSVTTLAWGAWDGGMVTPDLRDHFRARGVPLIDPDDGARAFADHLLGGATGWVLLGAPDPLTGDEPRPVALPTTTSRDLESLREDPVLTAHRIGDEPVLPATVALGWMLDATERRSPDRVVTGVRDLAVRSGLVYGADPAGHLFAEIDAPGADGAVTVAVLGARSTPRYSATLRLGPPTPAVPEVRTDWPREALGRGAEDGVDLYRRAVLFHGPTLQGVRRVLEQGDDRLVLECALPATPLARGAYAGRRYDPVTADVVLHGPLVLGHRLLGSACLPLAVGRIELGAVIPAGEPFVLLVENARPNAAVLRTDVTVCAGDGRVLQRWHDVEVVTSPGMDERFAQGVASWNGTAAAVAR